MTIRVNNVVESILLVAIYKLPTSARIDKSISVIAATINAATSFITLDF